MVQAQAMDEARAEAFAGEMLGMVNHAFTGLMVSVGHETGLLDQMAELPPATSEEIAAAAGLNERYVREWLGAVTTAGIVIYDPSDGTYTLPPEHAACLTRAAGPDNLAAFVNFLPEFGKVSGDIVSCFRNGGGVPYSRFERFQTLMGAESAQVFDATLLDVTLPLVPGLPDRLESGIEVADVGCGAGHAVNLMAQAYPASRFIGYDFSEEGIELAKEEVGTMGLDNATFEVRDIAELNERDRFDFVTAFDTIHDQAKPAAVLDEIHAAVRPGGDFLCVDIQASSNLEENLEHPLGPALYAVSTMHCMTVSLAYGGVGLGTVWGEQKAIEMMEAAGFRDIRVEQVEGDIMNNYYVAKKRREP